MRRKTTLRELLSFKPKKGPGFGIEPAFYLHVLAAKMPLPSIREVVEPKGENGAVAGFGVPLSGGKETLDLPMERGTYAIASVDRKTVIKCLVISKEEAGFDPEYAARSSLVSPQISGAVRSTWMLVQLSYESYDPTVYPAVQFMLSVAKRIGELTDGVVADPEAQQYRVPTEMLANKDQTFSITDVVGFEQNGEQIRTAGLVKFGLPELELRDVPESLGHVATRLLASVAGKIVSGVDVSPGSIYRVDSTKAQFQVAWSSGGSGSVLELIPDGVEGIGELLARMDRADA